MTKMLANVLSAGPTLIVRTLSLGLRVCPYMAQIMTISRYSTSRPTRLVITHTDIVCGFAHCLGVLCVRSQGQSFRSNDNQLFTHWDPEISISFLCYFSGCSLHTYDVLLF